MHSSFLRFVLRAFVAVPFSASAHAEKKVIRSAQLWEGTRLIADAAVVVDSTKITELRAGSHALIRGTEVIDLRSHPARPGLMDRHFHMTYFWDLQSGFLPFAQPRRHPAETIALSVANARAVKAGLTPAPVHASATTIPAELLLISDRLGKIAPDYLPDHVAFEGDPTNSIQAFHHVRWMMNEGAVVVDQRVF
jgi:hypothetical protein